MLEGNEYGPDVRLQATAWEKASDTPYILYTALCIYICHSFRPRNTEQCYRFVFSRRNSYVYIRNQFVARSGLYDKTFFVLARSKVEKDAVVLGEKKTHNVLQL